MWHSPYPPEEIAEIALVKLRAVTDDQRPSQPPGELIYLEGYLSGLADFYENEPEGEFAHHARVDSETLHTLRAAERAASTLTDESIREVLFRIASQAVPDQGVHACTCSQTTETSNSAATDNEGKL
jgi:acyl-homoserine lactone acylase PvdQ